LVRQLLTESVVLTLPAGVLGIVVAYILQEMLLHLLPVSALGVTNAVVDGLVLLFALLCSVAIGLLVGVVPAIRVAAASPSVHLGNGRQLCEPVRSARLRSSLVIVQIAISIVLLIGSGLVARSLLRLSEVDFGFSAEQVLTARLEVPVTDYRPAGKREAFLASVVKEIGALPGVLSVGTTTHVPILDPGNIWETRTPDRLIAPGEPAEHTHLRWISPGYFAAMKMPLLKGREISETDREGTPAVAVLSESLARRLYADQEPAGRTVLLIDNLSRPPREIPYEVVGVVRNIRLSDPREKADPAMYLPMMQAIPNRLRLVVRTAGNPEALAGSIRAIVRRHDRNALLADMLPMDAIVDEAFSDLRRVMRYLGLFAGLALALAAVGLYGALAYHVGQQEREIGVRRAMGATRADILALVLRRGTWLVVIGLLAGAAGAYPCTLLVQDLLFETIPLDPTTYVASMLLLGLVAAAACLMPAMRATRVDPAVVLRRE
jgi:predicted permease